MNDKVTVGNYDYSIRNNEWTERQGAISKGFETWIDTIPEDERSLLSLCDAYTAGLLRAAEIAMQYGMKHDHTHKHSHAIAAKDIFNAIKKEAGDDTTR